MSGVDGTPDPIRARGAGVLLHPSSLPGGTLDAGARFVDFLAAAGLTWWQMLPVNPADEVGSPYQSCSAFAGDIRLVVDTGDPAPPDQWREQLAADAPAAAEFERFRQRERDWLEDYARYRALKDRHGGAPWWQWPEPLRDRDAGALARFDADAVDEIGARAFEQYVFFARWRGLREYARARGVRLIGDLPIFVAHDSADVWAHRQQFKLGADGHPRVVAGVPPDYFSELGQRWGNPVYDWDAIARSGYRWWAARVRTQLQLFDRLRLDHFRGFLAAWEIPADSATAVNGAWQPGPGRALFDALRDQNGALPFIAEDLGIITADVTALRRELALPGITVLQFGFDGSAANPYLPHNHERDTLACTGTHDNDTTASWFLSLDERTQRHVCEYLDADAADMPWSLIRAALASVARLAVIPMQDLLALGSGHRMNTPGTNVGNWRWRFAWDEVPADLAHRMRALNRLYGRCD
ncbi:MAG: 4-alpha-glucanotransferase [Gammaproteobacteria bacterium]